MRKLRGKLCICLREGRFDKKHVGVEGKRNNDSAVRGRIGYIGS